MNRKQLIIAAMSVMLSVTSAGATSVISGVTVGGSGTFNIDPSKVNGDVGYRQYDYFNLGKGDVANLNFNSPTKGRDIETFVNLVNNQINVNGVLNTVRNGQFHNGHAVFISPKGMVVGASGVLNVGTLSVLTPAQTKYNSLKDDYKNDKFDVINNISAMRNSTYVRDNNHGGNAPVDIKGLVMARNGVDIRGSQVNVSGGIVNGFNADQKFSDFNTAKNLFDRLVNTDGINPASGSYLANNGSTIVIKSGADTSILNRAGINISGKVANLNNTEMAITNHGSNGLTIGSDAVVVSRGKLNVYNNSEAKGAMNVYGKLSSVNDSLSVTNKGTNLNISGATLKAGQNVEVVNNKEALGTICVNNSKVLSNGNGKIDIVNHGKGGINIYSSSTIGGSATNNVRIVNENGKLVLSGKIQANDSVSARNHGAQGMTVTSVVNAGKGILLENTAGDMNLNPELTVETGNIHIANSGNGKLSITGDAEKVMHTPKIQVTHSGNIAIRNDGKGGMVLVGTINGNGDIAINNYAGDAVVNANIDNIGNTAIINREGSGLTVGGTIKNEGNVNIKNVSGQNGLKIDATINNEDGNITVYNEAGRAEINGTLNNANGNTYIFSQKASNGLTTGVNSKIVNEGGSLAIKHNGSGKDASGNGMNLNGYVENDADIAINNYTGSMYVGGEINEVGNGTIGIINRSSSEDKFQTSNGAADMTVEATINGGNINIKNNGNGNMTVRGDITHNGRLNVIANDGQLTLGGKITNNGSDMTYATARTNSALGTSGDGITVEESFNAVTTKDGTILIKNISGQNGLNYAGSMTAAEGSDAQIEIYNKTGDMNVTGTMEGGKPAVILNTGNGLTVTEDAKLQSDVVIVNRGTTKATIADKYLNNFREKLRK